MLVFVLVVVVVQGVEADSMKSLAKLAIKRD